MIDPDFIGEDDKGMDGTMLGVLIMSLFSFILGLLIGLWLG